MLKNEKAVKLVECIAFGEVKRAMKMLKCFNVFLDRVEGWDQTESRKQLVK